MKKNILRVLAVLVGLTCCLGLAACGNSGNNAQAPASQASTGASTPSAPAAPAGVFAAFWFSAAPAALRVNNWSARS